MRHGLLRRFAPRNDELATQKQKAAAESIRSGFEHRY
jgi:hypothetical protein